MKTEQEIEAEISRKIAHVNKLADLWMSGDKDAVFAITGPLQISACGDFDTDKKRWAFGGKPDIRGATLYAIAEKLIPKDWDYEVVRLLGADSALVVRRIGVER